MGPDDIHIDGDLFIQKEKCFDVIDSFKGYDFIYSFFEPNSYIVSTEKYRKYYSKMLGKLKLKKELFTEPYILPENLHQLFWPNTSFMKFNNMELKEEYIRQYLFFINNFRDIDFEDTWPDLFFEQYHMMLLSKHYGYKIKEMITGYPTKEANDYALEIGFTHLGPFKLQFEEYFNEVIRLIYPEEYKKMMEQIEHFKQNKPQIE